MMKAMYNYFVEHLNECVGVTPTMNKVTEEEECMKRIGASDNGPGSGLRFGLCGSWCSRSAGG
jgi:hypothetical protein